MRPKTPVIEAVTLSVIQYFSGVLMTSPSTIPLILSVRSCWLGWPCTRGGLTSSSCGSCRIAISAMFSSLRELRVGIAHFRQVSRARPDVELGQHGVVAFLLLQF